ncbi:MAG: hypothetical protein LBQ61_08225 [Spirochaetales bacterium]|nr:hypothetical protein [Spirochaetales bacterium]
MKGLGLLRSILQGYYRQGRNLLSLSLFFLGSLLLSAGIVFPLWYFAVNQPRLYTRYCLILLAAGAGVGILLKVLRTRRRSRLARTKGSGLKGLFRIGRFLLRWVCAVLWLYFLFLAIRQGSLLRGILTGVAGFFLVGWLFFGLGHDSSRS